MSKYRKYLEFAALFLLAGLIIWWFGRQLDWDQVKTRDQKIRLASDFSGDGNHPDCLSLACGPLAGFAQAFDRASLREVWVATCVGFGAVLFIGRAGEVVRPVVLPMRDHRVRPAASFVTIMIERLYDTITVVLLFALSLLWLTPAGGGGPILRGRE